MPGVYNELEKQKQKLKQGGKQKTAPTLRKDSTNLYNQLRTKNSHEYTPKSTKQYFFFVYR